MVQVAPVGVGAGSGQSRPASDPKTGWFVYMLAFSAVIGGFLFGYDTGIVSAAMLYVPNASGIKPLDSVWQEIIVSVTPGVAAIGSLCSGPGSDFLGRKKIIIGASVTFTIGAIICAAAWTKIVLLIGRILLGLAIGFASMIVPIYVSEASPSHIRGKLVTGFQLMITVGLVIANIIGGAFSYVDPDQVGWRLMFAFAAVPAIIQFVCFLFLPESPRWLYEHGRTVEAREVLTRIYNGHTEWVDYEMNEISFSYEEEIRAKAEHAGNGPTIFRILKTPHVRKASCLELTLLCEWMVSKHLQFKFLGTILVISSEVRELKTITQLFGFLWELLVGLVNKFPNLNFSFSAINFIGTFIPIALVERVGRRVLLLVSMVGVILFLIAMGVSFLLINNVFTLLIKKSKHNQFQDSSLTYPQANYTGSPNYNPSVKDAIKCMKYSNCDFCVTDEYCGFCEDKATKQGYCLPFPTDDSSHFSATGICQFSNLTGNGKTYEWEDTYCHTKFTVLPIIIMVFYLLSFSAGYAPLPWVLNAEFYPLWARSTAVSISTAFNWIFNLIVSLTFLSLSQAATKYGTFFIYCGCTIVALIFVFFFVPETKGYSIDEVEMLFMTKEEREKAQKVLEESKEGKHRNSVALSFDTKF
ncbi:CRE-HMIT-1.3 protein [Caenorhabditis remanei]|uniref:CRE-HMIT-1.3 protein n=1 Tax=Caenorhabditis remanei TaxID=31234 RepID=E3LTA2_CAERE|nr:CRE-HMIT-1.3 protein [Caenorhabditis remanei]